MIGAHEVSLQWLQNAENLPRQDPPKRKRAKKVSIMLTPTKRSGPLRRCTGIPAGVNAEGAPMPLRPRAAAMLLPYQHERVGRLSKQERAARDTETAGIGTDWWTCSILRKRLVADGRPSRSDRSQGQVVSLSGTSGRRTVLVLGSHWHEIQRGPSVITPSPGLFPYHADAPLIRQARAECGNYCGDCRGPLENNKIISINYSD